MPPRELTAEDIADWLTPGQAVKMLDAAFQKSYLSKQALLGRLAGGMAEAVSLQTVRNDSPGAHGGACSRRSPLRIGEEFNRRTPAGLPAILSSGVDCRLAVETKPSAIMR
jgi:hypothetical protein